MRRVKCIPLINLRVGIFSASSKSIPINNYIFTTGDTFNMFSMSLICYLKDETLVTEYSQYSWIPPPPLSRDRRGRGGAMSHSIDRLFPLLTIHRVGVEVVNCQACPVDYTCMFFNRVVRGLPLPRLHVPSTDSCRIVVAGLPALFECP